MKISFKPLSRQDFVLLLKWLQKPHVKKWWDKAIDYNIDLIIEKYSSYIKAYKQINGQKKAISAFIIYADKQPIGYIHYYSAHDFLQDDYELNHLPQSLAAIDLYIGDEAYLGKGIGQKVLTCFLQAHVFVKFNYALLDPDSSNITAIKTYKNSGFTVLDQNTKPSIVLMLKAKPLS